MAISMRCWMLRLLVAMAAVCPGIAAAQTISSPTIGQVFSRSLVQAVALQPDGKLVIGGQFSHVGNVPRPGIARFNTDGTLDAAFDVGGLDGNFTTIYSIVVDGAGNVYVGGSFTSIGGVPRNNIARLSGSNGAVDPGWIPNALGDVLRMALEPGGANLIVGGSFSTIGGVLQQKLAKVSTSTGAVDINWAPQVGGSFVHSLAIDGGNLFVGGVFSQVNGTGRWGLAKITLAAPATLDAWNPGVSGQFSAIALDGASLFVAGSFSNIGGLAKTNLAKLSTSGAGAADATWNPAPTSPPEDLVVDGASLYVSGFWASIGGVARSGAARLSTTGTGAVDSWHPNVSGTYAGRMAVNSTRHFLVGNFTAAGGQSRSGLAALSKTTAAADLAWPMVLNPGNINAIVRDTFGATIVGGNFVVMGDGITPRDNLARFNSNGSLDSSWTPGTNGEVSSLTIDASQNVYAGGFFTTIGGQNRNRLARLSSSGTGVVDSWNPNADNGVLTLLLSGSNVYVGGYFANVGGLGRNRIAKVSTAGVGAVDAWNPSATSAGSANVNAIVAGSSGEVYAGGTFDTIGGLSRSNLAKLSQSTGLADASWTANTNGIVFALSSGGGSLYVGGGFTTIGGQNRNGLARVTQTNPATVDATWNPGLDTAGVRTVVHDGGSNLYVGGQFNTAGGLNRKSLARVSTTGAGAVNTLWDAGSTINAPGIALGNGRIYALALDGGLNLYVGGQFMTIGSQVRSSYAVVAALAVPGAPTIGTATPGNLQATISFLPPSSDGGSAITGYTVTCSPGGGATGNSSQLSLTVTGLTNGQAYSCSVRATNAIGQGPASGSVSVTPAPNSPPSFTSAATATFLVGAAGAFTVTASGSPAPTLSMSGSLPSGFTFNPANGLLSGAPLAAAIGNYPLTFTAINGAGPNATQSFLLIVAPNVPAKPTITSIAPSAARAKVAFAISDDGGAAVVSNTVTCTSGASTLTATGSSSPIEVTGLNNGAVYSCRVTSTNSQGESLPSDPADVTPSTVFNLGTFNFGGQSMATTSLGHAVTLTNNGALGALSISTVSIDTQFGQVNNCGSNLGVGATCTVTVSFSPVAVVGPLNSTVAVNGTLVINTNVGYFVALFSGTAEKSLVTHYYNSILRRAPDAGGKAYWVGEATRVSGLGASVNEVWFAMAQQFYTSGEYVALNRSNNGYVSDLYTTFYNRAPDTAGLDFWVTQLSGGMPREVLLAAFMFSTEFANFTTAIFGNSAVRAEVNTAMDFYRGLLSRLPDDGGLNFWLAKFRLAQCLGQAAIVSEIESISSQFALSGEYTGRNRTNAQYVGDLYNAFLRRGGDLGGVLFWINQIATGAQTREQVRVLFKNSPEFQSRVNAIIAQGCFQ